MGGSVSVQFSSSGLSVDFLWTFHGLSMDFLWTFCGRSVDRNDVASQKLNMENAKKLKGAKSFPSVCDICDCGSTFGRSAYYNHKRGLERSQEEPEMKRAATGSAEKPPDAVSIKYETLLEIIDALKTSGITSKDVIKSKIKKTAGEMLADLKNFAESKQTKAAVGADAAMDKLNASCADTEFLRQDRDKIKKLQAILSYGEDELTAAIEYAEHIIKFAEYTRKFGGASVQKLDHQLLFKILTELHTDELINRQSSKLKLGGHSQSLDDDDDFFSGDVRDDETVFAVNPAYDRGPLLDERNLHHMARAEPVPVATRATPPSDRHSL